ncbi:Gor1p [Sugiyamaella lignohabitans]|uniref:Gor1p n=1 Tax=Sugiyamaella lignohabitans TaxID=796027 RepID=A0A161HGX6_9ASCO|nr:Gor1p [Sugiyamaella lignohabitans]ANB11147.1 Gor1p [Sugiyamaella lignohabitans]
MTAIKNQILLLGSVSLAKKEYQELSELAELISYTSSSREEFIADLKTKYKEITAIYSTFAGEKAVGGIDEEIVSHFPPSLKYICHNGAGYDLVQVEYLTKRGIQLSNTPDAVANATADTAVYLILSALRNFSRLSEELRKGNWLGTVPLAREPKDKVLGILGMGSIGHLVHEKVIPLGFSKVIYYNRHQLPKEKEKGAEYVTFDELLAQSDVLFVSVPLNAGTRHIINAEALAKAKDGVVVVNTARGAVIDEEALVQALESGKVSNVGLDVFEFEPKIHPGLLANPNAVLLPHVGTHTVESRTEMELTVIRNIRSALTTGKVIDVVPEQQKK